MDLPEPAMACHRITNVLRYEHLRRYGGRLIRTSGTTEYGNNAIRMAPAMRATYGEEGCVRKSALGIAICAVLLSIPPAFV